MTNEATAATAAVTDTTTPAVVQTPSPAPVAAVATPQAEPSWLPERLKQAKDSAYREALKSLGFDKPEDAKASLDELKRRRDAEKTEHQRLVEENNSLKTKATRADELESAIKARSDVELSSLTEKQRVAIAEIAGADPARVLKTIDQMRAAGMLDAPPPPVVETVTAVATPVAAPAPAAKPAQPASVSTAPAAKAPPPASSENDGVLGTYERLLTQNPMLAAQYRLSNFVAIAAEQKARG